MHEYSIVRTLIDQVQDIASRNAASAVTEVVLAVGPLSNVEPLLLHSAFEQLAGDGLLRGAQLTIEQVALTIQCDTCGCHSTLNSFVFICERCGSATTRVVSGEDVMFRHVVLQVPGLEEANKCHFR
jgi:hydrogenase nickel incorporation protein HypA/HybF